MSESYSINVPKIEMKTKNTDEIESNLENLDSENENLDNNSTTEAEVIPNENKATTLDTLGDTLVSSMPSVSEHAIDLEETKTAEFTAAYSDLVDKNGNSFDPKLHKTKNDGSPTISKTGKLMLKPNATKHNTPKKQGDTTTQISSQDAKAPLTEAEKQQCQALGKVSANALFSVGRMLGGEEWAPVKAGGYDEAAALEQAFGDYFEASGKTEMSPSTALCVAVGSYMLPRFTMPVTKQKSQSFAKKAFAWWNNRKGAKEERARQKAQTVAKNAEKQETTFEA